MHQHPPDDHLDHYALGFHAPGKGLGRDACPHAKGTEAHAQWISGYDAAPEAKARDGTA
ncbi:ribosome modulation factor [Methylobacterium sp. J-068]|uniref:ribosome modulation factor n=1 Tax=Methylobacterium sp. J-068 TaxID=2836649 RepID=UPI001FB92980|nr:ribosome modulation factor [Methylobacterium sp. J-068]MCJ2035943.1 ribosome modulation factor [Methylobacterium sp. J-068]